MEFTRPLLLVAAAVSLPAAAGFTFHANNKHPLTLQLRQLHQEAALTSLSMLSDQEAWELAQEQQQQQQQSFSRGKAHTQVAASGGPTTYRPDSISHGNARVVGPSTTRHERRRQRPTPKAAAINRGSSTKMRWESSASTSRAPPPPPVQQRQRSQQPTSHRGTTRQQQQQPKRSYFSDMPSPHRPRQAQPRPVAREQPPPPPQRPTTTTTTRQHPSVARPVRNPYYRPAPEEEEPPQVGRPYSPYGHTPVHHHQQQQQQQPQQSYYNQAPPQQQEAPPSEYKQRQQQPSPEYRQPQQQQPQFQHDPTVAARAVMITNENRRILIEELGYPRRYVQAMNFEAARDIVAGRVRYQ